MNFLQLSQRLRRKCRVSGAGPSDVTGQVEEYSRLIDWINEAWMDIQLMRPDWMWMRTSASFVTVASQAQYTILQIGLTDFGGWTHDTFRCYPTVSGVTAETPMEYLHYDEWRDTYLFGGNRSTKSRPTIMSVGPDMSICLGPVPDVGFTVTGDYYKVPSEMTLAADIPALPTQFHMAIVYKAMMYYGESESAPEIYNAGKSAFKEFMSKLALARIKEIILPGPLA